MRRALAAVTALLLGAACAADPRVDYLLQCAGCHRVDGRGLPPEIPSLVGTPGRLVATPAGREYLARVPGAAQAPLDDAELAAVLNWVLREFSAATLPRDFEALSEREVARVRRNVLADPHRFREQHWPGLGYGEAAADLPKR